MSDKRSAGTTPSSPSTATPPPSAKPFEPWPWALAALAGIGGIVGGVLGVSAYLAYRLARPLRSRLQEAPPGGHERVRFPASDGVLLSGWLLPASPGGSAVILCHGFQTGRQEVLPLALALRERGHHILLFDFRGHGESEGRWTSLGLWETGDLEGAVRYLLGRADLGVDRVGVVGFSMGGAVAILTAARLPEIAAVVSDSAYAALRDVVPNGMRVYYRLPPIPFGPLTLWFGERYLGVKAGDIRPVDAIAAVAPRPILLIHGAEDRLVPLADACLLHESAAGPCELWIVPGADHVAARNLDFEGYVERVDRFLKRHLGEQGR